MVRHTMEGWTEKETAGLNVHVHVRNSCCTFGNNQLKCNTVNKKMNQDIIGIENTRFKQQIAAIESMYATKEDKQ